MHPLNLSPLPSAPSTRDSGNTLPAPVDGFVDDAVITTLLAGPASRRPSVPAEGIALSTEEDFAGWHTPRNSTRMPPKPVAPDRTTNPGRTEDDGLGAPYHGGHRWWIAGLAGAMSTMLFALLLLSLAARVPNSNPPTRPALRIHPSKPAELPTQPSAPAPSLTDARTFLLR